MKRILATLLLLTLFLSFTACGALSNKTGKRALTLDDVRLLAQKGEALSWTDFDPYRGSETGPGTWQYVIDSLFDVLVGGDASDTGPEYVRLRNRDINAWVDIRTDDIENFIRNYQ